MKQRIIHSAEEIDQVLSEVCDEYESHGLLTRGLWRAPVVRVRTSAHIGLAEGLYVVRATPALRLLGFRTGHTYVPMISFGAVLSRLRGQRLTLRDVMRHELAHALAYKSRGLVRGWAAFERAFGDHHDAEEPVGGPRRDYVTDYAQEAPGEDFAESVMVYLRHDGRLDRWAKRPVVQRKLNLVASLPARIRRMGLRA